MKKDIHPTYYPDAQVICACGNTWTTGSTKKVHPHRGLLEVPSVLHRSAAAPGGPRRSGRSLLSQAAGSPDLSWISRAPAKIPRFRPTARSLNWAWAAARPMPSPKPASPRLVRCSNGWRRAKQHARDRRFWPQGPDRPQEEPAQPGLRAAGSCRRSPGGLTTISNFVEQAKGSPFACSF